MSGHLYRPPPSVRQVMPERDLPQALDALVLACLSKSRAQRPASARELAARLRETLAPPVSPETREKRAERPPPVTGPDARPVALIEVGGATYTQEVGTALAVAGYPVCPCLANGSLEGMQAVVVVPGSLRPHPEALLLASTLASRPQAPPVLLCGSGDDFELMSRAIAGGVYDYVPLPLDPPDLVRKVARALRSRR